MTDPGLAIIGILALVVPGAMLLWLRRWSQVAVTEIRANPAGAANSLHGFVRRFGLALGAAIAVESLLLLAPWRASASLLLEARWIVVLAFLRLFYFGGLWMALGVERAVPGTSWGRRSRFRVLVALSSSTWLPLAWGGLGPLAVRVLEIIGVVALPPWTDGAWIPLGLVYAHYVHRLIRKIGRPAPLPPRIASAYAEATGLEPQRKAELLVTGDAEFANAFTADRRIYITDSLADQLTSRESAAILLHEEGHLVAGDLSFRFRCVLVWQVAAAIALAAIGGLNAVSAAAAYGVFVAFVRPRLSQLGERRADVYAAARIGDPGVLASALKTLHQILHAPDEWGRAAWAHTHPDLAARLAALGGDFYRGEKEEGARASASGTAGVGEIQERVRALYQQGYSRNGIHELLVQGGCTQDQADDALDGNPCRSPGGSPS